MYGAVFVAPQLPCLQQGGTANAAFFLGTRLIEKALTKIIRERKI
jgi:hypothetical protein